MHHCLVSNFRVIIFLFHLKVPEFLHLTLNLVGEHCPVFFLTGLFFKKTKPTIESLKEKQRKSRKKKRMQSSLIKLKTMCKHSHTTVL